MDSAAGSVPDRWLGCPAYGDVIEETFIPMKTFLGDEVSVPPDFRFSPQVFMRQMKERNHDVGLIINLTFSTRYYDCHEIVDDFNVEYKQIACRGHNEAPQASERADFSKACNSFLVRNPRKLIAVHCTHGFNRTGFMICQYLCSERDYAIDAAVALFGSKRPPGIYKQDYLNELHNLFLDSDDPMIEAPQKPIWDSEEGLILDGLTEDQVVGLGRTGPPKEFYEGVTDVELVRDQALKQRIYRHCCQLCNFQANSSSVVFPGAQPVSMDRKNLQLIGLHPYRVSWKADGCRYMMYIEDEDNIFFLTRSLYLWRVHGLKFPKIENLNEHLTDTLVDGEMVTDIFNGQRIPKFLIYDVISLNGKLVANENFDKRCGIIKCVIVEARRRAKSQNIIPVTGEPFKISDKGFFWLEYSKKTWELDVTHEKDGLIFQPVDDPYTGGTCHAIMKWKPPELNSIDFKVSIREERQNGCLPETMALLHVSNKTDPLLKIKLTKDEANFRKYNNKIVEMSLVNNRWKILRERTDKLSANSFETAISTYESIKSPVTEEILFGFIDRIPKVAKRPAQQQRPNR